jgi:2',3'-cyclic-nucleotide 2'-phosphodiesterase
MKKTLNFLFIGDVISQPGLMMFQKWAPKIKEKHSIDIIIVNGENSSKNGRGITAKNVDFFKHNGVSIVTTGNHVWENKEFYNTLNLRNDVIRPANYPPGCPGKGYAIFEIENISVAVINLHGRIFVKDLLDCPFRTVDSLLTFIQTRTNVIFVDFHAEATSEKKAMGIFLDGRVSGVFGTHTHVQTSDARILPNGTAFITDLGSSGAIDSVIGMQSDGILKKFLYFQKMGSINVETAGPFELNGVVVNVDTSSGKALKIESVKIIDNELYKNLSQDKKES